MSERLIGGRRNMTMGLASSAFLLAGALSGCSGDDDPSAQHITKNPTHSAPFKRDEPSHYIKTGDGSERAPYVTVPLVDTNGHHVKADEIILKGIGTDFFDRDEPDTKHNHVTILFPRDVVEVAVFALKNGHSIRCQSLLYPNKSAQLPAHK